MGKESGGESGVGFPETLWSKVQSAGRGSPQALGVLALRYRPVVLKLVTWSLQAHGHHGQDAEDLTQEFFVHLLEHSSEVFGRADPARGRFRAWLRTCLKFWLANQDDRRKAQKRGGRPPRRFLDAPGGAADVAASDDLDSEFDRQWARDVMARATARLREDAGRGRLEPHDLAAWDLKFGGSDPSDREIAEKLGVTENAVVVALRRTKRLFREHLRHEVSATVATEPEVDEEIAELRRCLGRRDKG